ncbi:hypothetical protein [Xanthomonas translucens]|uniref:hypothetical protein n=1 Tax=Xanthomonas campestris pv. translucens TaxID=343 RepID=UPI0019D6F1CA|nr:hypothetical protein [Xanthomonas translucens]QSQ62201.1 hypothetical protein ISN38_19735 [Xanthomonas translucens pv. undulosa]
MSNAIYFTREAQGKWIPCNAATLGAAKRASVRAQMFQGTDAWVGKATGDVIEPVAVKRAARLDVSVSGKWVALDPANCSVGDFGRI